MANKRKPNRQGILRYVRGRGFTPVSELRRYFGLESEEEAVLRDEMGAIFSGLPPDTAQIVLVLAQDGKIGLEYSVDFDVRVLIGIYPIRKPKEAGEEEPTEALADAGEDVDGDLKTA